MDHHMDYSRYVAGAKLTRKLPLEIGINELQEVSGDRGYC